MSHRPPASIHAATETIASWVQGDCDRVEWAELARHFAVCEECEQQRRAAVWLQAFSGWKSTPSAPQDCLSGATLERFARRSLSARDVEAVSAHLSVCDQCRLELEMLAVDDKDMLPCG